MLSKEASYKILYIFDWGNGLMGKAQWIKCKPEDMSSNPPDPRKKKSGPLECTCNHIIGGVEMLTPGLPVSLAKSLTPNSVRDPVFKKMRWNVTGEDTQHWPLAYTTHTHTPPYVITCCQMTC